MLIMRSRFVNELTDRQKLILILMHYGYYKVKDLLEITGLHHHDTIRGSLKKLVETGLIDHAKHNAYFINTRGREVAADINRGLRYGVVTEGGRRSLVRVERVY